jgi:lysosomal alpha-mannosidase
MYGEDKQGREIVITVKSDVKNEGVFYTDSNGLDLMERKLNYRPCVNFVLDQYVASNYYPVNGMIGI